MARAGQRRGSATLVSAAVLGIVACAVAYVLVLPAVFGACAGAPLAAKIALSVVCLAPLAFCMGIPFPSGLQLVSNRFELLVPWAWGINGCTSVTAAALATFIAVHAGFRFVVVVAVLVYAVTPAVLRRLNRLSGG